jgi:hypothetical protein
MTPRSRSHRVLGCLLAIGLTATAGCESQSSTSTGPSPLKCQVSLDAPSDSLAPSGGQGAIAVTAPPECAWTAAAGASWLTGLTPSSGQGSGRVEFRATDNPAGTMRQSYIAINDVQASVQQQAAVCRFEVSPLAPSVDAAGGTVTLVVTTLAGCGWEARATVGWVALSSTNGMGSGSVSVRVQPIENESRSAAIVVAGQTVTLTQSAADGASSGGTGGTGGAGVTSCSYSITPGSLSLGSASSSATLTVSTAPACSWTVTSGASWITTTPTLGSGAGIVTVAVAANGGAARTSFVSIAGQTATVSQTGHGSPSPPPAPPPTGCTFSISPTEQGIGEKGGAISVAVSTGAGCAWTATSDESWIVITAGATGSGPGTVSFDVAAGKKRNGTLTIAGQTFTVRQSKKDGEE